MVKKRTIKIVMFYLFCLFPNSHLISLFKISSLTFRLFFHYKLNRPFFFVNILRRIAISIQIFNMFFIS